MSNVVLERNAWFKTYPVMALMCLAVPWHTVNVIQPSLPSVSRHVLTGARREYKAAVVNVFVRVFVRCVMVIFLIFASVKQFPLISILYFE